MIENPAGKTAASRSPEHLLRGALLALGAAFLMACTEPVDLLLHSGTVLVMDEAGTSGTAMVVRGGRVHAVGGGELRSFYQPERIVDLGGRTLIPGFNDAHTHIRGRARRHIPLAGVESIAAIGNLVRA